MWPVMVFYTNSTIHMIAHGSWAEVMMFAGAVELARVRGKLHSSAWSLAMGAAFLVSGLAFLVHEQNAWFFMRSAFLHHLLGWTLVVASVLPITRSVRPRSNVAAAGLVLTFVVFAVLLYCVCARTAIYRDFSA